tara:strand:- start:383 stop:655 length:273 start_codon:yes stop_codon:yes gene_type:complete
MAEKKPAKKAAAKKPAAKKPAAKKAPAKKKLVMPPNPDRQMGAPVRILRCKIEKAAALVEDCGFFVVGEKDGLYELAGDLQANAVYEAKR